MTTVVNPLLFVSGTLLSSVDHPMARRLAVEADLLGPATFTGRLSRVAWYPGLVDGDPDDYERVERPVTSPTGPTLAWTYLYRGDVSGLARVADGRWRPGRRD